MLPNLRLYRDTCHPAVTFYGQGFPENNQKFEANVGSGGFEVIY